MTHLSEDTLALLVDQPEAAAEREEIRQHLDECAECRSLLLDFQAFGSALRDTKNAPDAEEFIGTVMRRISPPEQPVAWYQLLWEQLLNWAPQGLGTLAAMLLVFVQLNDMNPHSDSLKQQESELSVLSDISGEVTGYTLDSEKSEYAAILGIEAE